MRFLPFKGANGKKRKNTKKSRNVSRETFLLRHRVKRTGAGAEELAQTERILRDPAERSRRKEAVLAFSYKTKRKPSEADFVWKGGVMQ